MASTAGRVPDRAVAIIVSFLYWIAGFWIALMLIVLFSVKLGWLPSGGIETIGGGLSGLGFVLDRLRHLALPAFWLSVLYRNLRRVSRGAMLEVATLDFVRTARAKGLSEQGGACEVLPNALLPVTTLAGIHQVACWAAPLWWRPCSVGRPWTPCLRGCRAAGLRSAPRHPSSVLGGRDRDQALVDLLQAWLDPRISA